MREYRFIHTTVYDTSLSPSDFEGRQGHYQRGESEREALQALLKRKPLTDRFERYLSDPRNPWR